MQTVIFHSTIFGPVKSRRLGVSLGVNLMPNDGKLCSFDCLYCEAGSNAQGPGTTGVPTREQVKRQLKKKLEQMKGEDQTLDSITFSGNGEPTLHPQFREIVHDVMVLRAHYYPDAKVSVLSNGTMAARPHVAEALKKVDNNILKLDSVIPATLRLINRPASLQVQPEGLVEDFRLFAGQCILQTMFVRGEHGGRVIDNTTDAEVEALINAYMRIQPREVMVYSIDRPTPEKSLKKVPKDVLDRIGERIKAAGIAVQVNA